MDAGENPKKHSKNALDICRDKITQQQRYTVSRITWSYLWKRPQRDWTKLDPNNLATTGTSYKMILIWIETEQIWCLFYSFIPSQYWAMTNTQQFDGGTWWMEGIPADSKQTVIQTLCLESQEIFCP